jgi:vancomycin permeability regulator SanA
MATALNVFKTVTANLTTNSNVVYTAPALKTSIILSLQVTNVTNLIANTTVYHSTATNQYVELCKDFEIPSKDSAVILGGKLVLETGQKLVASAGANTALRLVMSLLETAND